jgi:glucokinase
MTTKKAVKVTSRKVKSASQQKYSVGIDLGGTKVLAALVDQDGNIVKQARRPTVPSWMAEQDPSKGTHLLSQSEIRKHISYVISAMADAAAEVMWKLPTEDCLGIGLASAGPMNIEKGTLEYPSNFKGWKIVPIVELLERELKDRGIRGRVHFQNDAIASALGEGWKGSAQNCKTYVVVTVGTGIGSGVIFNGKPAQSGGMGSEWGHILVNVPGIAKDPESFAERSVEGLASGTGLILRARKRGFKGETTADLAKAAKEGNRIALELFSECSEALASMMYTLSLGFHPQKIVFSGGMLKIRELYLPKAITLYRELIKLKNPNFRAPVEIARLGSEAGVIGAAYLPYLDQ